MTELFSQGKTLPEVYHNALWQLYYHGDVVDCTDYNTKCLEASATLVIDDPLREPMISKYIPCGQRELQQYLMEMLDGILDWAVFAGKEPYTYHLRMVNQFVVSSDDEPFAVDQIKWVLAELKRNPDSRRAVIDCRDGCDDRGADPACLQHIQFFVRKGKLDCKVLFRSNDACKAAFMNAFALIMLQKRIADELGVPVGQYVHRANSFHAYERDWESLNSFIKRFSGKNHAPLVDKYEGKDGWKEEMESYVPDIMRDMERLKEQCGANEIF